jgi:hypothetical protein
MKKALRFKIFLVFIFCLLFIFCDIFNPKKYADVIMIDGPRLEEGDATFSYVGTVRNAGQGKALNVRVYIELKNPDDVSLAQGYHLVDKTDLEPGESSAWRVTFDDEDLEIRSLMDESKTSYDITWSESEDD